MEMEFSEPLKLLGLTTEILESIPNEVAQELELARVISVHRDSYTISNGTIELQAELLGKLLFNASTPNDLPTTGDWVLAHIYDKTGGIIHQVMERRSLLTRKTSGKKTDYQLIGANVDVAFIVQSLDENYNLRRLERYLVMVRESKAIPVLLLSKSDLLSSEEIQQILSDISTLMPELAVTPFSSEDQTGLSEVKSQMQPGLTYCLLGSSGVGKTTLINKLIGTETYKTSSVSKIKNKGKHTTTQRHLIQLDFGPIIIDTPGMRELGSLSVEDGLDQTFSAITSLAQQCKFNDCTHTNERGCAVLAAIENGTVSAEHFSSYLKLAKESAYNEMSYQEKRKKDKMFGKHVKSVMQQKQRKY